MKLLIAGIGNIFMGDDAFGCEVARELGRVTFPDGVDVADFGIRGMDLSYALMEGYDVAILVDAMQRGTESGTLSVIEPRIDDGRIETVESGEQPIAPHGMDPVKVLRFAATLGERLPRVLLVACEPESLGGDAGHMGLSEAVAGAVGTAVGEIRARVHNLTGAGAMDRQHDRSNETHTRSEAAPGGMS